MSETNEMNQLLREIRDEIRANRQEASEARKAIRDMRGQRGAIAVFLSVLAAVYFGVYLALVSVKYIGGGLPH